MLVIRKICAVDGRHFELRHTCNTFSIPFQRVSEIARSGIWFFAHSKIQILVRVRVSPYAPIPYHACAHAYVQLAASGGNYEGFVVAVPIICFTTH
jgi:hypothetical protein